MQGGQRAACDGTVQRRRQLRVWTLLLGVFLIASSQPAAADGAHAGGKDGDPPHRPRSHERIRPFVSSAFYQPHDPAAPPKLPSLLNVSRDDHLAELLAAVAYKNEIIMFAFNSRGVWLHWALAMADTLRRVGYQHFFALGEEYCCVKLQRRDPGVPCVFSDLPGKRWRQPKATGDGFVDTNPEDIWIMRYRVASDVARRRINILVLDLDCIFRRDVYADLKSPPLANATLIHQEEGFANGGLFYIQNAHPNGPALWTHDEVWRRTETVEDLRRGDARNFDANCMDQALLNDAINAAALPDGSAFDWPSVYSEEKNGKHPFWHDEKKRGEKSRRGPGEDVRPPLPSEQKRMHPPALCCALGGGGRRSEFLPARTPPLRIHGQTYQAGALFVHEMVDPAVLEGPIRGCNAQGHTCRTPEFRRYIAPYLLREKPGIRRAFALRIPRDTPERQLPGGDTEELFMAAPFWTFGHREDALRDFDISALSHLVGTDAGWLGGPRDGWRNGLHAGRRAMMAAAGNWPLAPREREVRRKFVDMGASMPMDAPRVPVRYAALSPHLARAASGNTIGDEPLGREAAGVPAAGDRGIAGAAGRLLGPGQPPVRTKNATTHLILRFAAAALALNRTPALFGFPCGDAPWLARDGAARLGVYDLRVVKHGELCYPGVGGQLCGHELVVYDFELGYAGAVPRTVESFDDALSFDPEAPVVQLRHLPERLDAGAIPEQFREVCSNYFEAGDDEGKWEERDDALPAGGDGGERADWDAEAGLTAEKAKKVDELLRQWEG